MELNHGYTDVEMQGLLKEKGYDIRGHWYKYTAQEGFLWNEELGIWFNNHTTYNNH